MYNKRTDLFYRDRTSKVFGDAKKVLGGWIKIASYSIGQTHIGTYEISKPFLFKNAEINELNTSDIHALMYTSLDIKTAFC